MERCNGHAGFSGNILSDRFESVANHLDRAGTQHDDRIWPFLLDNQTEKMTKGPLCLTRRDLVFREPGAVHVLSTGARVVVETIQAVLFTVNNQRKIPGHVNQCPTHFRLRATGLTQSSLSTSFLFFPKGFVVDG